MFNINYKRLITWYTPWFMRKPRVIALLRTFCAPVVSLHNDFIRNRANNLYKVHHNSQVYSLENVLNDRFDISDRRIYIEDGFAVDRVYIYTPEENKPVFLGTVYLYNPDDYQDTGTDFIVWVPKEVSVTDQELIELKSLIDFYKLAGKRYKVYRK